MGQAELQPRTYTVEEYMELEQHSDVRHGFYKGEVFAMAGARARHNILSGNIYSFLRGALRGKKCRAFFESVQLQVEEGKYYNLTLRSCPKPRWGLQACVRSVTTTRM